MDFYQRFKTLMGRFTFQIPDEQHREWFIAALLPHIRLPLSQHKITSQSEALEIAMKLEASPVGENVAGMAQVQSQLAAFTIQLQEITKGKEKRDEIWCVTCKREGHYKHECPVITEYLATGAPNPIHSGGGVWCEICRTMGHHPTVCPLLHKYQSTARSLFCNFCQSVGHDETNCRALDLMRERTSDAYRVKG